MRIFRKPKRAIPEPTTTAVVSPTLDKPKPKRPKSKKLTRRRYSEPEVEQLLTVLALEGGSSRRASRSLKGKVSESTLRTLAEQHPDTFHALMAKYNQDLQQRRLSGYQRGVAEGQDLVAKATALADEALDERELKDAGTLAGVMQKAAITTGIFEDKVGAVEGRPQKIEHTFKTSEELLRAYGKPPEEFDERGFIVDAEVIEE